MFTTHSRIQTILLAFGDLLFTGVALAGTLELQTYSGPAPKFTADYADPYLALLAVVVPLWLGLFWFFDIYKARRHPSIFADIRSLLASIAVGILCLAAVIFLYWKISFSAMTLLLFGAMNFGLIAAERLVLRSAKNFMERRRDNAKRLLIVGAGDLGLRVLQTLQKKPSYGYNVVGLLDDYVTNGYFKKDYGVEVLGRTVELVDVVSRHDIDKVIIALPQKASKKISRLVDDCEGTGIEAEIVPDYCKYVKPYSTLRNLDGVPLLGLTSLPIKNWTYRIVKRSLDIFFTLILLALSAPIIFIVALVVKLTSSGPVFFAQERIGSNGKGFKMIKFRTMLVNAEEVLKHKLAQDPKLSAEWQVNFKLRNDPRITPVGKFLRKTSLDELPQLVNVLRGQMSLVGPRPLPTYHQECLPKRVSVLRNRVRPGMTGLWQVSGRSELNNDGLEFWDSRYVENWSLWMDLKILVRTIPAVLKGTGAS
jgi:exopolysaccharide biosynthesis polyprenyl glycosylphosphotransferase